ncbi:PH domain-containing protein [Adhaeribacter aquaticus]|uniref:PH domain-containing protein n=1 Tax=Adhaeribacter aquaticus TaxID=299567 RepID=UPI000478BAFD|nr:PH domain-containing protein [Adhaeribacter aquaticus]
MRVYKANRKGPIIYLIVAFAVFTGIIFLLAHESFKDKPLAFIILLIPTALLLWIYFDTFYAIANQTLKYRSAFLSGEIRIGEIREIVKGKTLWVGIKPALAKNGLIIKYNKFDEIYIAPENNDEMIIDLLKINHKINII